MKSQQGRRRSCSGAASRWGWQVAAVVAALLATTAGGLRPASAHMLAAEATGTFPARWPNGTGVATLHHFLPSWNQCLKGWATQTHDGRSGGTYSTYGGASCQNTIRPLTAPHGVAVRGDLFNNGVRCQEGGWIYSRSGQGTVNWSLNENLWFSPYCGGSGWKTHDLYHWIHTPSASVGYYFDSPKPTTGHDYLTAF